MTARLDPPGIPALLHQATAAHRAGDAAGAEARYRQILEIEPGHFDALHALGILRAQQGRNDEALSLITDALRVNSGSAMAHLNCGNVLLALGRREEALASYDKSLVLAPRTAVTLTNRGNVLLALRRFEEALDSHDKALALVPGDIATLNNRATALVALRRPEQALRDIEAVLATQPRLAEAYNNRGNALKEMKRFDEALANYARAIELRPGYAKALNNRGAMLFELGMFEEALASLDQALAVAPNYADALNHRGNALLFLGRFDEATRDYESALTVEPNHPWAPNGLADAVSKSCDWSRAGKIGRDIELHIIDAKSVINPFTLLGYHGDPRLQLECAQAFFRNRIPVLPAPLVTQAAGDRSKIRVAYLSADFRIHPVASLVAELFENHDRDRFEIFGFAFGADDGSAMRARLVNAVDSFHDVRLNSDIEIAEMMRDLQIDIAVDLTGYTHDARPGILSYRPAPVQVNYLGFPATTGSPCVDYILADETALPFDEQRFYSERIVHLPDCYMATDSTRPIADRTPTREEAGLPEHGFVFCCFNSSYKITAPIFGIWMRLLNATEGSVLWLSQTNHFAMNNLQAAAKAHGIDPVRLVFAPRVLRPEDHLARYRLADLFLDTLPFNAHTTAADALWAGLPLLTCRGTSFAGRVAASLLRAIGLPDLVTEDLQDYEATAIKLAGDPALLGEYRARLMQNRKTFPLFDAKRFCSHIESAYSTMWQRHLHGQSPEAFAVPGAQ